MKITADDFTYIRDLVRDRTALVLTDDKSYLVETRLHGLAQANGKRSVHHLLEELRGKPFGSVHQQAVDALMTHETFFFRDEWPFQVLVNVVFPRLRAKRAEERRVTMWSAACSTGQEAYSLAICAHRYGFTGTGWDVKIVATDVSAPVLERVREGRYSKSEIERGLDATTRDCFFRPLGGEWFARDDLRAIIETRRVNLAEAWLQMPRMDVVFLRNVLIYFEPETRRDILRRVHGLLRPDGYLFLGGTENTLDAPDLFERQQVDRHFFYQPR